MAKNSGKHARGWLRRSRPQTGSRRPGGVPGGLRATAISDVGCVRGNNEDTFRCDEAAGLYVVCDGMGGMAAGEIASQVAADTVMREFARSGTEASTEEAVRDRLAKAIAMANREVLLAAREPGRKGMGTTLVAAAVVDKEAGQEVLVANVGDSRAYVFRNGVCRQITRDHSYANEVQRVSGLQPEEISPDLLRRFGSLITRAIGAAEEVEPDFFPVQLAPGDVLLLASDGLTRYFEDSADLLPLLDPQDLQGSCRKLIEAAKQAGGVDNITVLLLARGRFS